MGIQDTSLTILDQVFDFSGSKVALLMNDKILTSLRDDMPSIPHPNMLDLPGGGREAEETPFECLQREVLEELSIHIHPEDIIWAKVYPGMSNPDRQSVFMVGTLPQNNITK